jgi:hypothetical protein
MASETKSELVEELSSQSTKADLIELLGSRLKKDEISKLLDDESDGTKEELLRKLGSRTKDELVQAVESRLTKDEIEKAVDAVRDESDEDEDEEDDGDERSESRQRQEQRSEQEDDEDDDEQDEPQQSGERGGRRQEQQRPTQHVDDSDLDWSSELEWAPPPRPTPAPVAFVGAAPFMPGARVRVDLSGLPTLGVFLGKGASAAGTITGVNAHERTVRVYLDACFDGRKEIFLPPERIFLDPS